MESNVNSYKLEQGGKNYIVTTSIEGSTIKISCKSELVPTSIFSRTLSLESLKKIDSIFAIIKTPLEALEWIDKALKIHKVRISEENSSFKIIFHITTSGVDHQIEIPLAPEGQTSLNINTENIISGTGTEFVQETKTVVTTKTITEAESIREIGLDPSLVVTQTQNADTDVIIKAIEEEKRKSLSLIKYDDANININTESLPLTQEGVNIKEENQIDINAIVPEVNTEIATKYEDNNINLAQLTENIAQSSEIPENLNTQYITEDNTFTTQDANKHFDVQEYQITDIPQQVTSQYTETNQMKTTFDMNQIPETTTEIQTNTESLPFITPADDIEQNVQITTTEVKTDTTPLDINIENYGVLGTTTTETQYNTQDLINNEFISTEGQNIQDYGFGEIQGETNVKLDELNTLNTKYEEINIQTNTQDNELEMLKMRKKELEELISKYREELMRLRGTVNTQEITKEEKTEQVQKYTVKGDIIHNSEELELITKHIKRIDKKIILNLIYKATVDSDKASAFHEKCDKAQSSLVLIETDKGKRFGGFTTSSWSGNCIDKKDEDAFVFSLDKMMTYENIPGEEAIGCYPKFGPIFLGCQIRIYDDAFSKGGTTYEKGLNYNTDEDYVLNGGDRIFGVKEIEVYEVIVQ